MDAKATFNIIFFHLVYLLQLLNNSHCSIQSCIPYFVSCQVSKYASHPKFFLPLYLSSIYLPFTLIAVFSSSQNIFGSNIFVLCLSWIVIFQWANLKNIGSCSNDFALVCVCVGGGVYMCMYLCCVCTWRPEYFSQPLFTLIFLS